MDALEVASVDAGGLWVVSREIHVDLMRELRKRMLALLLVIGVLCLGVVTAVTALVARWWIDGATFAGRPFGDARRSLAYVRDEIGGERPAPRAEPISWRPPGAGGRDPCRFRS